MKSKEGVALKLKNARYVMRRLRVIEITVVSRAHRAENFLEDLQLKSIGKQNQLHLTY